MADRIQPLKLEHPDFGGTETDIYPTGSDKNEDHIEVRGVFLQDDTSDDETVHITRDSSGRLTLQDSESGDPMSLTNVVSVDGEPVGFPNRTDSQLSFVNGTRTFTISPTVTSFDFYVEFAKKYTKTTAQNVVIPDTEGIHFIYFGTDGVLASTTTFSSDLFLKYALVSILYWDTTNDEALLIADERHGLVMSGATHLHLHQTLGTVLYSGLSLDSILADENGNDDTHAQLGVAAGTIADEDLIYSIAADTAPAQIPGFYLDGASANWRRKTKDNFPVITHPSGRLAYNEWTGSLWQQSQVSNGDFVLSHLFATNDPDQPVIFVQGQNEYANLSRAREGAEAELANLVLVGLPTAEFVAIATVIFQTRNTYSNAVEARIRSTDQGDDYIDWRFSKISPSSPPQDIVPHKLTHHQSGSDEIFVQDLGSDTEAAGKKLESDGAGGLQFVEVDELPAATDEGQVLYSLNGSTFTVQQPLVSSDGWLTNNEGILLIVG